MDVDLLLALEVSVQKVTINKSTVFHLYAELGCFPPRKLEKARHSGTVMALWPK